MPWRRCLRTPRSGFGTNCSMPYRNGILTNVRFVLCGQKPPPSDRDWQVFIVPASLKPLGRGDIEAYLMKKVPDLDEASLTNLATVFLGATKGNPASVASLVDGFLETRSSETGDL